MDKIFRRRNITFILGSFLLVAVSSYIYYLFNKDPSWFMMNWNFFLAFLPYLFSILTLVFIKKQSKILPGLFFILWLLFFPNSPYMLTDVKYIGNIDMNSWMLNGMGDNVVDWIFLIKIVVSVLLGLIFGMLSLYEMHNLIKKRRGTVLGWGFVSLICIISSFGVYIGRFLRVNSWDVLKPIYLLKTIINSLNSFTLVFTLIFAIGTLFIYLSIYWLIGVVKR